MTGSYSDPLAENRLPESRAECIDRARQFTFEFDGRDYPAYAGDTIASALAAGGVDTFSRSFKYHRRRGLLCLSGDCPNCMVRVDGEPNVRACLRAAEPGMSVQAQNAWPSLEIDLMSLVQHFDRFLPPGFYYKAFMRPRWLWPLYERFLRAAAGLGQLPEAVPEARPGKRHIHAEIAVIGGGPAGMAAAAAAAEQGARVILLEETPALGGHLRYRGDYAGVLDAGVRVSAGRDKIEESDVEVIPRTHAFGWYDHGVIGAAAEGGLLKVHAAAFILATGARERFLSFRNNDLPGVMFSGAAQRLIRLWRVRPGRRALVYSGSRYGYRTALDLQEAGVEVRLMDLAKGRSEFSELRDELGSRGVELLPQGLIRAVSGRRHVCGAEISDLTDGSRRQVDCDLLVLASPLIPANDLILQTGVKYAWDENAGGFRPGRMPPGIYVAGGAAGIYGADRAQRDGHLAGLAAAEALGYGVGASRSASGHAARGRDADAERAQATMPSASAKSGGKRDFVCLCEDVTRADIRISMGEGYQGMELLKRYATVGMGPCQGKICGDLLMRTHAEVAESSLADTQRTTSRPPVRPVRLGTLAGDRRDPLRLTPLHAWHVSNGAQMMVAGQWMRPEHYGDPMEEVRSVRSGVGLIDVSTLGKILVHGPDAHLLLNYIYTNRWKGLRTGAVRYGVMVNEEGVVLDDGVSARLSEDWYYLTTTSGGSDRVYEWIQWWLQSGLDLDVHAVQVTDHRAAMNLTGPLSRRVLSKVIHGVDLDGEAFPYMHARQGRVAGAPALLLRIGFTGELGYEIHVPSGYGLDVWEALLDAGAEFNIRPFGLEAQRVLRLEKGHIIVGQDTDGLTNPLQARMGWAVDLEKDEFVGRRSLLRLMDRGSDTLLVGFTLDRDLIPEEGTQVVRPGEGPIGLEIIGRVTSARYSPTLGRVIGLGWLPADMAEAGSEFLIRSKGEILDARVVEVPFYDPAGERQRE